MKMQNLVLAYKTHHLVGKNASALPNKSATVKAVNAIRHARPCRNRTNISEGS
jgi:hypothetical protein